MVFFLGDADDQSNASAAQLVTFFSTLNATVTNTENVTSTYHNRAAAAAAAAAAELHAPTVRQQPHHLLNAGQVVTSTGGVRGDIDGGASATQVTVNAFVGATIAAVIFDLRRTAQRRSQVNGRKGGETTL